VTNLQDLLLGGPKFGDDVADAFAAIEAERKADFWRAIDLGSRTGI